MRCLDFTILNFKLKTSASGDTHVPERKARSTYVYPKIEEMPLPVNLESVFNW